MATAPKTSKTRIAARRTVEQSEQVGKRRANQILAEGSDIRASKAAKEKWTAELRRHQASKAKMELEITRGEHIPLAEAIDDFRTLGEEVRRTLESWTATLPGRLEGLTAAQMVPIFEAEVHATLTALANGDPAR
jgi:hypothetical protein